MSSVDDEDDGAHRGDSIELGTCKRRGVEVFQPHTIMKHQSLDWNKHCRYEFGTYVQANQDNLPTNTNAPRTVDAIYLRPCWDRQGRARTNEFGDG